MSEQRKILYRNDFFEIVQIAWASTESAEAHDHGFSRCLVLIEEGVFENKLILAGKLELQVFEVGQVVETPIGAQHEMRCLSPQGRTLHVYSPPLNTEKVPDKFNTELSPYLLNEIALSHSTTLNDLKKIIGEIQRHSISTLSPYFMNQLFSGIFPQMLLAEDLISQTKTTLATYEASPVFSSIEAEVISALGKLIGWAEGHREGVSVPGGSAANFMAIHCARQKLAPHIKKNGLRGEKFNIFVSSEAHYSFKKACVALGLGSDSVTAVPVNERGIMRADELDRLIQECKTQNAIPLMVSATAGTTVLGAFDNIEELSKVCKQHNIWLHVDGAWGGPALFSQKIRDQVAGIELADSVTFDAHKLFGASLTCSFFLTSHPEILLEANDVSGADYLFHADDETIDRGKFSWQCGRPADAVSFWTIWKNLGTKGLGELVDRLLEIQQQTTDWIKQEPRLELVGEPGYLNICVRVKPADVKKNSIHWSKHVREVLKEKNLAMVNYSTNADGPFLRFILAHPFLEARHVQQVLQWTLDIQ